MKKFLVLILGLANLLPYLTTALLLILVGSGGRSSNIFYVSLGILTVISVPSLMAFYIVNSYRSNRIQKDQKTIWIALLFFGSIVVFPIYWYLYVLKEPKELSRPDNSGRAA